MARSTARKRALNTLFEADVRGQEFTDLLTERIAHPGAQTPLPDYAIEIVHGVSAHRRTLDKALGDALESWEVKRMPAIDRNLARMAAWEIVYNDEIPAGVAINEAIALAKTYAGDDTPDLLFGVLSTVEKNADAIRTEEIEWQEKRAAEAAAQAQKDEEEAQADTSSTSETSGENTRSETNLSNLSFADFSISNTSSEDSADSTESTESVDFAEPTESSESKNEDAFPDPHNNTDEALNSDN